MVLIGQRLVFTSQSHPCHFSWGEGLFASGPKILPRCLRTKMRTPFAVMIKWGTVTKTRSIDSRIINYVLHCVYNIHVSIQINIMSINVMNVFGATLHDATQGADWNRILWLSGQITKGSVSYLSSPCFSTIIGGIGGPARGKRRLLDVMY